MADDTPDPVAAALAEAKRIADGLHFACRIPDKVPDFTACGGPAAEAYWAHFTPARIVSLLAAVKAALKLPAEWRQESEALRDAAGKVWEDAPDAPGVRLKHAYAAGYAECAKALEAAIAAALAGKGADDGH